MNGSLFGARAGADSISLGGVEVEGTDARSTVGGGNTALPPELEGRPAVRASQPSRARMRAWLAQAFAPCAE